MMRPARALSLLILAGVAASAHAQSQLTLADLGPPSGKRVREAFAIPYGKRLIAEFGAILRESADAACLKEKALDVGELPGRAEALLVKYGTVMFEATLESIDQKALEAAMAKAAPDGKAELDRLKADADVKRMIELSEPLVAANVINQVTENVDRVALLAGIKFKRQLSPISTGNQELLEADPSEKSLDEVDKFVAESKSPAPKRYVELMLAVTEAVLSAQGDRMLSMGPRQYMPGLEDEFVALCIPKGR